MPGVQASTASERERAEIFIELGFEASAALMLAATRDLGEHVDPDQVRKLLEAGCTHELALRIVV